MLEPLGIHHPAPTEATANGRLHCLIMSEGVRVNSCYIPGMHVTPGTKFVVEQTAWRIEQVEGGCEEFDRVVICVREYS